LYCIGTSKRVIITIDYYNDVTSYTDFITLIPLLSNCQANHHCDCFRVTKVSLDNIKQCFRLDIFLVTLVQKYPHPLKGSIAQLIAYSSFSLIVSYVVYRGSFIMNMQVSTRINCWS